MEELFSKEINKKVDFYYKYVEFLQSAVNELV
jgi:hypothetical protein